VKITFPYPDVEPLEIPQGPEAQVFPLPDFKPTATDLEAVKKALANPTSSKRLSELARGKKKILIVADDITRPTPIHKFIHLVLDELALAGVKNEHIEFIMALGTHRAMTKDDIATKLRVDIAKKFRVHNHDWKNPDCLEYVGDTEQNVPVWVNKLVSSADLVIGLGSIMPIEVCGFTGGGKILVPGVCGRITCDEMHWTRIDVPAKQILGKVSST
jgi:nickel-dependent lactate racemase